MLFRFLSPKRLNNRRLLLANILRKGNSRRLLGDAVTDIVIVIVGEVTIVID